MLTQRSRRALIVGLVLALAALLYFPGRHSSPDALALDDGLARTPPMGWNSWNYFGCDVDERRIQQAADALVSSGMRDAGYQYVVVDDCWQVARDQAGVLVPHPRRFPHGMAALGDYIHARGLKFGLYTSAGAKTCMGYPGSLGHEWQDAATFAAWGVDYLKVDWCGATNLDAARQFAIFHDALASTGRPIVLSICTWGIQSPWDWGDAAGHLWRTTRDVTDRWPMVLRLIRENSVRAYAASPGGWNDPDMLEVGNGGMTDAEYRTHFSMWAMMAAPLIAGNDVRHMSGATRAILLNAEVIAVDQDTRGVPALIYRDDGGPQVWARPLADPQARAVALYNPTDRPATIAVRWAEIGLGSGAAQVRDLWEHADRGTFVDSYSARVEPHSTVMLRVFMPAPPPPPAVEAASVDAPASVEGLLDGALAPAPAPAVSYPYLTDLVWSSASGGHGPVERDMSNGEAAPGDGHPIAIAGKIYAKGLGTHAPSDIRYDLGGRCTAFAADVGLDAEVGARGAASFQVFADGALIYDSGVLTGGMPPLPVYLDIPGVHELRLVVAPAWNTPDYAHADWADARVACGG